MSEKNIQHEINVDITIIGGGIAGLWLLNRLRSAGYNAILFEENRLGSAQTIASQGMIHGGIKYTLSGKINNISEIIASMPKHWRACLAGEGDVDLSRASLLSDCMYLWSTASIKSKLTTFFASRATRGRMDAVAKADRPPVFQDKRFNGTLYRLQEIVVDVPSVISALANNYREAIFKIDWQDAKFIQANIGGGVDALQIEEDGKLLTIRSQRLIFSAGEGNEALLQQLSIKRPEMQRRPLHQVLVKHDYPFPLYAHCIGASSSPRLTVSSYPMPDGKWIWYFGGSLATQGVELSPFELITKAKQELRELLPWISFQHAEWGCLRINRAEPKQASFILPDMAYAKQAAENVIVAWPTKLTLTPHLANEVLGLLRLQGIEPKFSNLDLLKNLPRPELSLPFWDGVYFS
jgi:glycine/D-amino acid oxidase-like deaminating enzyme